MIFSKMIKSHHHAMKNFRQPKTSSLVFKSVSYFATGKEIHNVVYERNSYKTLQAIWEKNPIFNIELKQILDEYEHTDKVAFLNVSNNKEYSNLLLFSNYCRIPIPLFTIPMDQLMELPYKELTKEIENFKLKLNFSEKDELKLILFCTYGLQSKTLCEYLQLIGINCAYLHGGFNELKYLIELNLHSKDSSAL